MDLEGLKGLAQPSPCRIVLLVLDGLGGLPHPKTGWTELETAHTPHLDALARGGSMGLTTPVSPGITPGSGPGHLALFGYDPLQFQIGRGVMEALGIDLEVRAGDVAARGNFCTLDESGLVVDRRAGRIDSQSAAALCQRLSSIRVDGGEVIVRPVKEHRFVILLRGKGL
ncbi:MAG: phosphoglycerate mutase, partial [Chloroflexota bacterium]|nr:phosphoglycerate mutase [Chloroflexota bacterium]